MPRRRGVGLGHSAGPGNPVVLSESATDSLGPASVRDKTSKQSVTLAEVPPSRRAPRDVVEWGQFFGLGEGDSAQIDAHVRIIGRSGLSPRSRERLVMRRTLDVWRKVGRAPRAA